ncbi:hypothetical protein Pla108_08830 [Botrimarina colliarenosi]|uniref:Uncharacterized protein n=1 Tax=Botrimarina colliarenosi TaxID=2528001 RepID=A0A5C6AJX7_9BACT|nr:hypothetical protein [Botrimarina colliarenosi]TWT99939.1 hypothetical protein Pla108_08830 [Botrimarina colliarenosi]
MIASSSRHPLLLLGLPLCLLLALASGCSGPSFEDQILALATPTGALASVDPQLPPLIKAVEQQRGLPLQLAGPTLESSDSNAAVSLTTIGAPRQRVELLTATATLLDPATEPLAREAFVKAYGPLVEQAAAAVDRPRCRFSVGHQFGFFATMSYLDDAALGVRLLLVRALDAGDKKETAAALADVLRALRLSHWLADVRRVEARVQAATLRAESLAVAAELLEAGVLRHYEAEQIYAALRDHVTDWPTDERMLLGERATIIHAYEAIRAGMLSRLVTLYERKQLQSTGRMDNLDNATPAEIDADEARYLRAMQRLINAAAAPYPERLESIAAAMDEINSVPTLFAATLFTEDLPSAIRTAAEDRGHVEAWAIALALAADLKPPPYRVSPVTGEPYQVEREANSVTVSHGEAPPVSLGVLLK